MSFSTADLRLFGLDLSSLGQDFLRAWRGMRRWRVMAWLQPRVQVYVQQTDRTLGVWQSNPSSSAFTRLRVETAGKRSAPGAFHAIEIPEDLLLRRAVALPPLPEEQIAQSVALEVRSTTPFVGSDLVWGYAPSGSKTPSSHMTSVEVVQASRAQIEAHLRTIAGANALAQPPEVWASLSDGSAAFHLPGFGENRRLQYMQRARRATGALMLVLVALLVLAALTPTLKLRARAIEAVQSYESLSRQVAPLVREREELVKSSEQTTELKTLLAQRVDPLRVMNLLTKTLADDTVLDRFQVEGRTVRISGQTTNAAAIMQQLGALPEIAAVKAPVAATKPLGAAKESFQIEFTWVAQSAGSAQSGATGAVGNTAADDRSRTPAATARTTPSSRTEP